MLNTKKKRFFDSYKYRENFTWQAISNSAGTSFGQYIGNTLFLTFESAKFCNQYIRPYFNVTPSEIGIISVKSKDLISN